MKKTVVLTCSLWLAGLHTNAYADSLPLWELGASFAWMQLADYRGSAEKSNYLVPLPYVAYRGERLRVGRTGIKGVLYDTERTEADISLFGSPPVESDDVAARAGMEDLDATLEIGPTLAFKFFESQDKITSLEFNLPLRAVIATDLRHFDPNGWVFFPHLDLLREYYPKGLNTRFEISAGPLFATQDYHEYFYGVAEQDATAQRPAFEASGGYSGARLLINYRRYFTEHLIFRAFFVHDDLSGAAFADSPLVTDKNTFIGGVMLTWIFSHSQTLVPYDE
ncbi:MAG: MipA/OmpV family protein [Pseudomonadota bacterium]